MSSLLTLLLALSAPSPVEHAKVTLDVESGGKKETAFVDQTPPDVGKNPRPVFKVKAGELVNFVAQQVGGKGGGCCHRRKGGKRQLRR